QPELGAPITTVLHKGQIFAAGNEPAREPVGREKYQMPWTLIVEGELVSGMSDRNDAAGKVDPFKRGDAGQYQIGHGRAVGGQHGIAGKRVLDVGQDQFLMLLLVMQTKFRQWLEGRALAERGGAEQGSHCLVDMGTIGEDVMQRRPRQKTARWTRVART